MRAISKIRTNMATTMVPAIPAVESKMVDPPPPPSAAAELDVT